MSGGADCRRAALEWMILLQERPDDDGVREEFQQWRREPTCDAAWRELDHVGDLIRQVGSSGQPVSTRVTRGWKKMLPLALAACFAALFIGRSVLPPDDADLSTGTGEVRTVRLPDGSRITLAPNSAIAVSGASARQVRLLRGTGFFDVRHDTAHPFQVLAGEAVAVDLGTAFEVHIEDDVTQIAVREGRVRGACRHDTIVPVDMNAGDMVTLDCAAGRYRASSASPSIMASWTQGQLVVTDRPLREVVEALRPWHEGVLVARGAGMTRHVTGVYDLRHPDRALTAISRAHGATVRQITPWLTIVTAD